MTTITVDPHRVFTVFVIATSTLCLLILYFMAPAALPFVGTNATTFSNLVLAALLMLLSRADTLVVPQPYRTGLRSLATMLFFAYVDNAACMVHTFVSGDVRYLPPDAKARGALRFSSAMILFTSCATFLYTYAHRVPTAASLTSGGATAIVQRVINIVAFIMLLLAQISAWAMTDMCSPPLAANSKFAGVTTVAFGILLLAGTLLEDREALDYAFVTITAYVYSAGPIFGQDVSDPNQDAFAGLWKSYVSFKFIAGLLVGLGVVIDLYGKLGAAVNISNIVSMRAAVQGGFFVLGITGAICVYAKSPSSVIGSQENWAFSFAWLIPILNVLQLITDWEYFRGVSVILSMASLPAIGNMAIYSVSTSLGGGYLNAGIIMGYFAILGAPIASILMERPFALRPVNEYFSKNFPTAAVATSVSPSSSEETVEVSRKFFVCSAVAAYLAAADFASAANGSYIFSVQLYTAVYLLLGNECSMPDVHRVLFFYAVPNLFATLWPISSGTSVTQFLSFFILGWFALHYIARYEDRASLHMTSGERLYEAEEPFLGGGNRGTSPASPAATYQRVPSGPTERSSLLAPAAASYQGGGEGSGQPASTVTIAENGTADDTSFKP